MGIYARSNQNFQDYTFAFCLDQELLHCSLLFLPHHLGCICPWCPWCIRDKLGRRVPLSTVGLGADHPIERLLALPG